MSYIEERAALQRFIDEAVAAERARCLRKAREIQAEHRAASEAAWTGRYFDVAANHQEAVACAEEIAQAIERGDWQDAKGCAPSLTGLSPEAAIRKARGDSE